MLNGTFLIQTELIEDLPSLQPEITPVPIRNKKMSILMHPVFSPYTFALSVSRQLISPSLLAVKVSSGHYKTLK